MDEFARRLREREEATQKRLRETMTTAEQLKKENAILRRVRNIRALLYPIICVMFVYSNKRKEKKKRGYTYNISKY